jgi:DNA-binding NarL/FixJ family response regulator
MVKKLKVLLVDDHPIVLDGYKNIFKQIEEVSEFEFTIRTACDCDSADYEIENASIGRPFDLVFLDIRLPPSRDKKLLSGEDLGLKMKSLFKDIKIMVFTFYDDNYMLYNIFRTLNPDGFLLKNETNLISLKEAINTVIQDVPYYSKTIIRLLRRHIINDIRIDALDRKLLHYLSEGHKNKELESYLGITRSAIDKRKKKLMDAFEIEDCRISALLCTAKDKGFV